MIILYQSLSTIKTTKSTSKACRLMKNEKTPEAKIFLSYRLFTLLSHDAYIHYLGLVTYAVLF